MSDNFYIIAHIFGAVVTLLTVIVSLIAVLQHRISWLRRLAAGLAGLTVFQMISGSLLLISSPNPPNFWVFCQRIGLYIMIIFTAEALIWLQLKSQAYPFKMVMSLTTFGLSVAAITSLSVYAV